MCKHFRLFLNGEPVLIDRHTVQGRGAKQVVLRGLSCFSSSVKSRFSRMASRTVSIMVSGVSGGASTFSSAVRVCEFIPVSAALFH
ncbi:MAG: hypothetical protein R2941_19575 [Desulfobacterales bacterium]